MTEAKICPDMKLGFGIFLYLCTNNTIQKLKV